jgi:putative nucleotidyltransferase with HDIG domain
VVERIGDSILRNGDALLALCRVKTKDDYTFQHSVSVGALLIAFCRELGMDADEVHQAGVGGMLHDLGKVRVPDAVLNKPGRLTDEEFAVMKGHVVESRRILEDTPNISDIALRVAAEHHERYDGSGYAAGLKGEAISRIGQMAAICDVYDAITSDRVYHKGMAPTEALRKIFEWSKFHFNPQLTQAFLRCIGIYPVGTLVKLESGRLAVVLAQHEGNLLQPLVRIVFHAKGDHYLKPEDLDLARPGCADRVLGYEAPEQWGIDPMRFM